jgi:hypothetical protein
MDNGCKYFSPSGTDLCMDVQSVYARVFPHSAYHRGVDADLEHGKAVRHLIRTHSLVFVAKFPLDGLSKFAKLGLGFICSWIAFNPMEQIGSAHSDVTEFLEHFVSFHRGIDGYQGLGRVNAILNWG